MVLEHSQVSECNPVLLLIVKQDHKNTQPGSKLKHWLITAGPVLHPGVLAP